MGYCLVLLGLPQGLNPCPFIIFHPRALLFHDKAGTPYVAQGGLELAICLPSAEITSTGVCSTTSLALSLSPGFPSLCCGSECAEEEG